MTLVELSPDQQAVLDTISIGKNFIITGCAGSGKTTLALLVGRKLWNELKNPNQKILFLTYSKLARARIMQVMKTLQSEGVFSKEDARIFAVHNFHSFWWTYIKKYKQYLGLKKNPRILTRSQLNIKIQEEFSKNDGKFKEFYPPSYIKRDGNTSDAGKKQIFHLLQGASKIYQVWGAQNFGGEVKALAGNPELIKACAQLVIRRNIQGCFSHDETIWWFYFLIKKDKSISKQITWQYPVIICDEFQDIDAAQYAVLKRIQSGTTIVLGDILQTIHLWRGASLERFAIFTKDFNIFDTQRYELITNHRRKNELPPQIITINIDPSDVVSSNIAKKNVRITCKRVALKCIQEKKSLAILCNENAQADDITRFLRSQDDPINTGIICNQLGVENSPYELSREITFNLIFHLEKKDLGKYLLESIIQELFPSKIEDVTEKSRLPEKKLLYTASIQIQGEFERSFSQGIKYLVDLIFSLEKAGDLTWRCNRSALYCIRHLAKELSRRDCQEWNMLSMEDKYIQIDNLILQYENSISSEETHYPTINIMTIHQSKSKEFDVVLIPWFSLLPWVPYGNSKTFTGSQGKNLYHTAITRAKEKVIICSTASYVPSF